MRLPNASQAEISPEKLQGYLLSETHPVGRAKAAFFQQLGFRVSNASLLRQILLELASTEEVVEQIPGPFGTKFVVDGMVEGTSGTRARTRTVWIVETGQDVPRLVTAYPA